MKKLLASLILAGTLCIGLAACAPEAGGSGSSATELLRTKEGFYAYSAASIGGIIDAMDDSSSSETPSLPDASSSDDASGITSDSAGSVSSDETGNVGSDDASGTDGAGSESSGEAGNAGTDIADEELATVNKYIELAESLLGESNISAETTASDRAEYTWKNVVSYKDLGGAVTAYTVYYNEDLISEETDGDEHEEEYRITGILIVDETEYAVEGKKSTETETEHGEEETENETWFRADLGNGDYIRLEQKTESERDESEQELVYTVRMNGTTEHTTLELEEERGEREVKMTVRKDGKTDIFEFEEETRGNTRIIEVTARIDGEYTSFTVRVTTDENGQEVYRYEFNDGGHRDFHRHRGD